MRIFLVWASGFCLALGMISCKKEPPVQYRLSPEQLAWQPYRAGEVLRFGHGKDARVRTYRISEVRDQMDSQYIGINFTPFPSKEPPLYQQIMVLAQRTDSVFSARPILELSLNFDPVNRARPALRAEAEWETFYYARLPVEEVNAGAPFDTLQYAARLLPSATFGPATYAQVIRVDNRPAPGTAPLGSRTRRLYYARGQGVVAFEEAGNDLWYRLP